MEENKVTISLKDYLEMHDKINQLEDNGRTMALILLNNCELVSNNNLKIDTYDLKSTKILSEIQRLYPDDYNKTLVELKKEANDE
jgi:hypothetical protein